MTSGYLDRLATRRFVADLKRQIVFGLVIGWMLVLICGFRLYFVPHANDRLMRVLAGIGLALLLVTLVAPSLLAWPERGFRFVTSKIGSLVFRVVLLVAYFVVFMPIGAMTRLRRGSAPFYAWTDAPPAQVEGWIPKRIPREIGAPARARLPLVLQPVRVLAYFVRNGRYAIVPVLTILLILGLLLFFAQSSALAPFIYTLF